MRVELHELGGELFVSCSHGVAGDRLLQLEGELTLALQAFALLVDLLAQRAVDGSCSVIERREG